MHQEPPTFSTHGRRWRGLLIYSCPPLRVDEFLTPIPRGGGGLIRSKCSESRKAPAASLTRPCGVCACCGSRCHSLRRLHPPTSPPLPPLPSLSNSALQRQFLFSQVIFLIKSLSLSLLYLSLSSISLRSLSPLSLSLSLSLSWCSSSKLVLTQFCYVQQR
jgi:hypothetical protein